MIIRTREAIFYRGFKINFLQGLFDSKFTQPAVNFIMGWFFKEEELRDSLRNHLQAFRCWGLVSLICKKELSKGINPLLWSKHQVKKVDFSVSDWGAVFLLTFLEGCQHCEDFWSMSWHKIFSRILLLSVKHRNLDLFCILHCRRCFVGND